VSQEIVLHSVFASGSDKLQRLLAELFKEGFREAFVDEAARLTIRAVEDILDPENMTGQPHFVLPGGKIGIPIPLPVMSTGNAVQMENQRRELASQLRVVRVEEDDPNLGLAETRAALDIINAGSDKNQIMVEAMDDLKNERNHIAGNVMNLGSAPETILCGWAEALSIVFVRSAVPSGIKRLIRRCLNPTTDGKRVSREPHEFNYCRDSGQIEDMVAAWKVWVDMNGGALTAGDQIPEAHLWTYGMFVDNTEARKMIAKVRKIRRLLRSANVKRILELVDTPEPDLRATLIEQLDFTDATAEFAQLNNL